MKAVPQIKAAYDWAIELSTMRSQAYALRNHCAHGNTSVPVG